MKQFLGVLKTLQKCPHFWEGLKLDSDVCLPCDFIFIIIICNNFVLLYCFHINYRFEFHLNPEIRREVLPPMCRENEGLETSSNFPNIALMLILPDYAGQLPRGISSRAKKQLLFNFGLVWSKTVSGMASFFPQVASHVPALALWHQFCTSLHVSLLLVENSAKKNWSLVLASSGRQARNHIGSGTCYHLTLQNLLCHSLQQNINRVSGRNFCFYVACLLGRTHHSHVLRFMSC